MTAASFVADIKVEQGSVLIVDNDATLRQELRTQLSANQLRVIAAGTAAECLQEVGRESFDVILLDVNLPDMAGIDVLKQLKHKSSNVGVIMFAAHSTQAQADEAMRLGALDFLIRPLDANQLAATIALAARARRLERDNPPARPIEDTNCPELIGASSTIRRFAATLRRVAEGDATVLIEGKPGSGKSTVARLVHRASRRARGRLVTLSAEDLVPEVVDAALNEACGGILLIEDVDRLSQASQSRIARLLKEERQSGTHVPDVRLIASTSSRLAEAVARGKFREDLYYRLNVFPLSVPSLTERREDIAVLAMHFLAQASRASGVPHTGFTATAMILLETLPWPGNLSQLQSAIVRAHALAGGNQVDRIHLLGPTTGLEVPAEPALTAAPAPTRDRDEGLQEEDILPFDAEEKRILARALRATHGNVRRAAELLKIGRATLYRKIQVYDLKLS